MNDHTENQPVNKNLWIFNIIVSVVGLLVAFYLSQEYYRLLASGPDGQAMCNFGEGLSCESTLLSKYSNLFGIPISSFACLFYLFIIGTSVATIVEGKKFLSQLGLSFVLTLIANLLSGYLAYVSFGVLNNLCVMCLTMYIVNFIILCLLGTQFFQSKKRSFIPGSSMLIFTMVVFGLGSLSLLGQKKLFDKKQNSPSRPGFMALFDEYKTGPDYKFENTAQPQFGKTEAPVNIIEFSDFQCPYCKLAADTLKKRVNKYPEQLKLTFFHYPMDSACNPKIKQSFHKEACSAAYASHCAQKQNKFWEYHDLLFKKQKGLSKEVYQDIAKELKLDLNQFDLCLQSEETKKSVVANIQAGIQARVRGTPTVLINGKKVNAQLWSKEDYFDRFMKMLKYTSPNKKDLQ